MSLLGHGCGADGTGIDDPSMGGSTSMITNSGGPPDITTSADGTTVDATASASSTSPPQDSGSSDDTTGGSESTGSPVDVTTGEPPGTCGNNVLENGETCDLTQLGGATCESLGHDGGVLACLLDCSDYNVNGCYVCGNGVVDQGEDCETKVPGDVDCESLGYGGGTVVCTDCFYDTTDCSVCGDGVAQGIEACDAEDFGGETCASLGLSGGALACSAGCTYDFSGCDIAGIPFGTDGFYSGFSLQPAVLPCDDISATGTPLALTDDSNLVVPMGFTFPVYGVDFTDINIQSNGTLRWGDASYLTYNNTCLPTATTPNTNTLYVFWNDLNPTTGPGQIAYQTLGAAGNQRFVVQYDISHHNGDGSDLMRFQVVLHEASGQIDVCYVDTINGGNTGNSGAQATSGIQQNGATALSFSCDQANLTDGTMLMYQPS